MKKNFWRNEFGFASPFLTMLLGIIFLLATGDADVVDKGEWWRVSVICLACAAVGYFHSYKVCGITYKYGLFWLVASIAFGAIQIGSTGLSF